MDKTEIFFTVLRWEFSVESQ